ncbi:3-isopropylmalate dehydratase small subunit [Bradyrhizobium sp. dw_411]|uniref:3-isopropylmalate dehydratase small subunit n=1 Tax=Bradyrhizobium sp. dw_411 TaxID=2720082 RepID=UPI001BD1502B|nr:3-isopropylmalate dehydratase small subunit [Bradyrhizobium sp. dw_411]
MEKFVKLVSIAAPLLEPNIDTDAIIPAPFLRSPSLNLANGLFFNRRFDGNGKPIEEFILNRAPFSSAKVLIGGLNFGCGSSREQAVWALKRFGFRCVIAPSFGEIFYDSCFKNGVLPIVLNAADHKKLAAEVELSNFKIEIDLDAQIIRAGGLEIGFDVPPRKRDALLQGLDEIGTSMLSIDAIRDFRSADRIRRPWVYDLETR